MAIRLLNKEQIATAKGLDRAREISEGLKISRKVDGLRELQANEEQALDKFRVETLKAMHSEISVLEVRKEELKTQVFALEEQAKQELSKTDHKKLDDLKDSLDKREKEISEKSYQLDLKEIDIALSIKESKDQVERQKSHEEIAKNLQKEAEDERVNARIVLDNAKTIEKNTLALKKETENSLALRENEIARQEEEITLLKQENLDTSRELEKEKLQLADQRKTLERALERLRKNRLA